MSTSPLTMVGRLEAMLETWVLACLPSDLQKRVPAGKVRLERPRVAEHGDFSCNIAMQISGLLKEFSSNPRAFATQLQTTIESDVAAKEWISQVEVAGPGFINLRLTAAFWKSVVQEIVRQGDEYGKVSTGEKSLILEFVSANPTGPLHVGHGRQAALGDALANLLTSQGWQVHREFYYNDAGVQIANLARSVKARLLGKKPGDPDWPEDAYNGDYIADIATDYLAKKTVLASDGDPVTSDGQIDDEATIRRFAVTYLRNMQDIDLKAFGVSFDQYYLESSLYQDGMVNQVIEQLTNHGYAYEKDGALWLRSTDFGDDKDRVMRKADGTYTYFVPDVAYHWRKWQRGFSTAINIQGSDHHGTIARVRAGLQALTIGIPKDYPHYILHKMVTVMKGGQEVKISKRAGSYVTLRDLVEWSGNGDLQRGRDVVRFFLLSRKADTEFVFDVDLALQTTDENPVFYVQFAHARICSILRQWADLSGELSQENWQSLCSNVLNQPFDLDTYLSADVVALVKCLARYPHVLAQAAADMAPHDIAFYLREVAGHFHRFYATEKILTATNPVKATRLAILLATRIVLTSGLALLGVSAPQVM